MTFILMCHLVTHSLAARHPHLEFSTAIQKGEVHTHAEGSIGWFEGFRSLFERDGAAPVGHSSWEIVGGTER